MAATAEKAKRSDGDHHESGISRPGSRTSFAQWLLLGTQSSHFASQHSSYCDPAVEAQFKLIYEGIRTIRSMAATYGLQSNIEGTLCQFHCQNCHTNTDKIWSTLSWSLVCLETPSPDLRRLFETQAPIYKTLIKGCETVTIMSSGAEVPPGCQSQAIGSDVFVHLLVKVGVVRLSGLVHSPSRYTNAFSFEQGVVNIQAEVLKKEKEIILIGNSSAALKKQMSAPAWAEKTKDEVRKEQEAKVSHSHPQELLSWRMATEVLIR